MTTTFLLLRHAAHGLLGRTLAGRMAGVSLSDEGRAQAERLADAVAREFPGIATVLSSPLARARETAAPLAARVGLDVRIAPELDEVDYGEWTGRAFDELTVDPRWDHWNARRSVARVPGGETMVEVQARVRAALLRGRAQHPDGTIAVVSHCETIRAALLGALGVPLDNFWRLEIDPASLSIVTLDEGHTPRVLRVNAPPPPSPPLP